ncbi:accessory Sec system protein Asp3 [Gemelliphila palaticanis]|uniref:Accessory Sec system protein Asp3 n=1 Tax=Gemelliphila palaticanis TaxID=81950 RepID=A0ABX2T4V2_9BACL|nr:accessory Sec system protein Asp3 [Gemella palaticanis]MBF0716096.1 accessory Sec system protein Asp3 [Gemella palaticanis]NYS48026.1 accessory Sec system protein Asp3 [Gemella palaticanis]
MSSSNKIYWNNFGSNSYLYGSTLKFLKNKEVYFKNVMANTGIVIKEWKYITNYQADRILSELPLLQENKEYIVELNCREYPLNSAYLRINFYNLYDELIEYTIIKNKNGKFIFPEKTYKYTVQLFSAGLTEIYFNYFKIKEYTETKENNDIKDRLLNFDFNVKTINVIFQNPTLNLDNLIPNEILNNIKNIYIYKNNLSNNDYYNYDISKMKLREVLEKYSNFKINFIGYTPLTNVAAIYYGSIYNSKIYIIDDFSDKSIYDKIIYDDFGRDIEFLNKSNRLILYFDKFKNLNTEKLFRNIIDYNYRLKFVCEEIIYE